MKFNKLIAAVSAVTMLGSLAAAVPASAAETDASVTAFDNFRVYVSGTNKTKTEGDITYYANAHIGNVLTGEGYNGGTISKTETTVSSRFYNLMRIAIPSGNTKSVTISVASASNNKAFEIYSYSSDVEWMKLAYTDNNHAGITADDYQTYYDASAAAGYDWSGLNTNTFTAVSPITTATTASGKLTFTLSKEDGSLTADDMTAGYKDILIKNTSGSACNLTAPQTPDVTTELEVVADPVAKIGSTEYASFEAAFEAAAANDTITLLDDVETEGRFVLDTGTATAPTYKKNISPLNIDGDGHTITAKKANNYAFLFETNGKTLNLNNITIVNERTYVINAKGSSTINLTDATVPANTLNTNNAGSKVSAANLNVAGAADGVSLFNSGSTLGTVNISLTEALAAEYDVVDGVLKAKAVEPVVETSVEASAAYTVAGGYDADVVVGTIQLDVANGAIDLTAAVYNGNTPTSVTGTETPTAFSGSALITVIINGATDTDALNHVVFE